MTSRPPLRWVRPLACPAGRVVVAAAEALEVEPSVDDGLEAWAASREDALLWGCGPPGPSDRTSDRVGLAVSRAGDEVVLLRAWLDDPDDAEMLQVFVDAPRDLEVARGHLRWPDGLVVATGSRAAGAELAARGPEALRGLAERFTPGAPVAADGPADALVLALAPGRYAVSAARLETDAWDCRWCRILRVS